MSNDLAVCWNWFENCLMKKILQLFLDNMMVPMLNNKNRMELLLLFNDNYNL